MLCKALWSLLGLSKAQYKYRPFTIQRGHLWVQLARLYFPTFTWLFAVKYPAASYDIFQHNFFFSSTVLCSVFFYSALSLRTPYTV